ncbi:MAG: S-methyl-5-thioribose-1-phosphate isomerase [Candidatus Omnitrophica bacterium]|nr:S-methyl-5-thioribose-1-phosphate isomerase [Candidatus Omnitrophota bacterium]
MLKLKKSEYFTLAWTGQSLRILDQTKLPQKEVYRDLKNAEDTWEAIRNLRVRGAPALGVVAAYGLYLGIKDFPGRRRSDFLTQIHKVKSYLETSRPTAVNLFAALRRVEEKLKNTSFSSAEEGKKKVLLEAKKIEKEDETFCDRIADYGFPLIPVGAALLTHCNAGALATAGDGTALAVIFKAKEKGKKISVFVDETRPLLQGSRLTAWELQRRGIDFTLICDNMAGWMMRQKRVDLVLVGADRIAANGDAANKVGTYSLAVLARHHKISFYIAAPVTTFDLDIPDGESIPIEERCGDEVTGFAGKRVAPPGVKTCNPAFDVTPASLITAFITDQGVIRPPYSKRKFQRKLKP